MKWVTSQEAARALGVTSNTLYAYVSRGMVRSQAGEERTRSYCWDDIEALRQRKRPNPDEVARTALHFGTPVIESAITCIHNGQLFYRGQEAVKLADSLQLSQLAGLLWCDDADFPFPSPGKVLATHTSDFLSGALETIATRMREDPRAWDLRLPTRAGGGTALLAAAQGLVCSLATLIDRQHQPAHLGEIFSKHPDRKVLHSVMVVTADHELNASTFTARCAASAGANLYCAVTAGLAALAGPRHGGAVFAVEGLLREAEAIGADKAIHERLRRGDTLPGFGHRLYPEGNPRAAYLLDLVEADPLVVGLTTAAQDTLGEKPSLDLALVALTRRLKWPPDWSFNLFALSRTVGWIAHILEEYARGEMIRPRARYVGRAPAGSG